MMNMNTRIPWFLLTVCLVMRCDLVSQGSRIGSTDSLQRHIKGFKVKGVTPVEALLQLGRENDACVGIEYIGPELAQRSLVLEVRNTTVGEVIKQILASTRKYAFHEQDGVVLVRNTQLTEGTWLDLKISTFQVNQASVQEVSNVLFMQLRSELDPKPGGFAGTYAPGDLKNLIGPFTERGRTLRQLLNLIVVRSKGGMWIADQSVIRDPGVQPQRFWTILEYSQPIAENLAVLRMISGSP